MYDFGRVPHGSDSNTLERSVRVLAGRKFKGNYGDNHFKHVYIATDALYNRIEKSLRKTGGIPFKCSVGPNLTCRKAGGSSQFCFSASNFGQCPEACNPQNHINIPY